MSGRTQSLRISSDRPIDPGSLSSTTPHSPVYPSVSKAPPPFPFEFRNPHTYPQPTGALHPATLSPISAGPPPPNSYYYRQNRSEPLDYRSSLLDEAYKRRANGSAASAGLHGLAEAALMEEARVQTGISGDIAASRRLPYPVKGLGMRGGYVSHWSLETFRDNKLSGIDPKGRITVSQLPSSSTHQSTQSMTGLLLIT